ALGQCPCPAFVTEEFEDLRSRADKGDPLLGAASYKPRVLTEKAVARMDGVTSSLLGHNQDVLTVEIARHAPAVQWTGIIRFACVEGVSVVLREDSHRPDAQLRGSTHDTDSDLTPVGNQKTCRFHEPCFPERIELYTIIHR